MREILKPVYINENPNKLGHVEIHAFNADDPDGTGDFAGYDPTADQVLALCTERGMTADQFCKVLDGTRQYHDDLVDDVFAASPCLEDKSLRREMGVSFMDVITRSPDRYLQAMHARNFPSVSTSSEGADQTVDQTNAGYEVAASLRERLTADAAARCIALNLTPDQTTVVLEMVVNAAKKAANHTDIDTPYVVAERIDRHAMDALFDELRTDEGGGNNRLNHESRGDQ